MMIKRHERLSYRPGDPHVDTIIDVQYEVLPDFQAHQNHDISKMPKGNYFSLCRSFIKTITYSRYKNLQSYILEDSL